jgi:hypothetical protein
MSSENTMNVPLEFINPKQHVGYPPYNQSINFELYFYQEFINENIHTPLTYIPIQWTNYHIQNEFGKNLKELNNFIKEGLSKNKNYFTVVQYDGGPQIDLHNTLIFSQGGIFDINKKYNNYLPLPLITKKKLKKEGKEKVFLASFSGRHTHGIRKKVEKILQHNEDIKITNLDSMNSEFTDEQFNSYKDLISESYFSLCPRGYGPTSFRLYESISLGTVPIYISDDFFLPFKELIDWENLAVLIKPREIKKIPQIIDKLLSGPDYKSMLDYGKKCETQFFNFEFMKKYIFEKIS